MIGRKSYQVLVILGMFLAFLLTDNVQGMSLNDLLIRETDESQQFSQLDQQNTQQQTNLRKQIERNLQQQNQQSKNSQSTSAINSTPNSQHITQRQSIGIQILNQKKQTIIDIQQSKSQQQQSKPITQTQPPLPQQQLLILREKKNQNGLGMSYTDSYNIQKQILQSQILNGKVFFLNKNPIKEHFWQALNRSNAPTTNEKQYEQFLIKVESLKEKEKIKEVIMDQKMLYRQKLENQFYTRLDYQRKKNTKVEVNYDGFPMPDNQNKQMKKVTYDHLPFCIVVPSFNSVKNQELYKRNINSILQQEYSNYHVVYIDDNSEDQTTEHVIEHIKEVYNSSSKMESQSSAQPQISEVLGGNSQEKKDLWFNGIKWTFVKNSQRKYNLQNIYEGIHQHCGDEEIAMIVEGDDALIGTQIFMTLSYFYRLKRHIFVYSDYFYKTELHFNQSLTVSAIRSEGSDWPKLTNILQTKEKIISVVKKDYDMRLPEKFKVNNVTVYEKGPAAKGVPEYAIFTKKLRQSQNLFAGHILSFYVSLFKKIDVLNFQDENKEFFKYAYDRALTLPLVELAYKYTSYLSQYFLYEFNGKSSAKDLPQDWAQASVKIRQKSPVYELSFQEVDELLKKVLKS